MPELDEALKRISDALDLPTPGTQFRDGKPRVTLLSKDVCTVLEELNRLARLSLATA